MIVINRLTKPVRSSFFLFGPRGTGKSLWVKNTFSNALFIDLLDPEIYRKYIAYPEMLKQLIAGNPSKRDIVIDEIQKVPQMLSLVHSILEENKNLRFILTGSSSRKLKRADVDLLAGRAIKLNMHPFLPSELGEYFSLEKALNFGLVPLIYFSEEPDKTLASYITLYIKEEVQAEALVRNVPAFSRFLETVSFSHANVLNVSQVSRECQVERKTVENYMKILEDLMLTFTIDVFSKKAKRKLVSHKKFYLFDTGVFRYLRPKGPLDNRSEIDGQALEGLVAQCLRAWIDYSGNRNYLYYWRTLSGNEIDFVLYGDDGLLAIEVKNSDKIMPFHLKGLKTFKTDYPLAQCILLYRGKEKLKIDDILCIPVEEFLLNLHPEKGIMENIF